MTKKVGSVTELHTLGNVGRVAPKRRCTVPLVPEPEVLMYAVRVPQQITGLVKEQATPSSYQLTTWQILPPVVLGGS